MISEKKNQTQRAHEVPFPVPVGKIHQIHIQHQPSINVLGWCMVDGWLMDGFRINQPSINHPLKTDRKKSEKKKPPQPSPSHDLAGLATILAALAVAKHHPFDSHVGQHLRRGFTWPWNTWKPKRDMGWLRIKISQICCCFCVGLRWKTWLEIQNHLYILIHTYILTLHYIALHCIALHCNTLHYITSHHITYIHTYGLNPVSSLTGKLTYLFHESQGII